MTVTWNKMLRETKNRSVKEGVRMKLDEVEGW